MLTVKVDGQEITVEEGTTVLQACEQAGIEIPRFCYHHRLSVAGNCRMCLVEVKPGPPKPVASCAYPLTDGMEISTKTPMVRKARKGVLEFLLINHPLDCPICDQGGECDLQDITMSYGSVTSRFHENKRAVPETAMGPLIKTEMTRCIHCTRCVRFSSEVCGIDTLGMLNRGENVLITTLDKTVSHELSGNLVDLCPVGALTSRPYAFKARPWELEKTESVDVMDAMGANIRVDSRGNEVFRVLPVVCEEINEEWISDKTRYACDGLRYQRLDKPYVRKEGRLVPASWDEALETIKGAFDPTKAAVLVGDQVDVETMYATKLLFSHLSVPHIECRQDGAFFQATSPGSYQFNSTIAGLDQADALLIIGANLRWEAPLLNTRIRKRWLMTEAPCPIAVLGEKLNLTYDYDHLGQDSSVLEDLAKGSHPFCNVLRKADRPMVIVGPGALTRPDGPQVSKRLYELAESVGLVKENWNGFNQVHTAASRVGGLTLGLTSPLGASGIVKALGSQITFLYLLGADEIAWTPQEGTFVVYQGHHGDRGAQGANVVLPGAAYTEKSGTFVNLEGRVQRTERAVFPPGEAQEDWKIIRALSGVLGHTLPFDTLQDLRAHMWKAYPHFMRVGDIPPVTWSPFGQEGPLVDMPLTGCITDFYRTCPISRASKTMALCSQRIPLHIRPHQSLAS